MTQETPLNGITVLDLTRVLAGPYATQWLGDLGAEVIKVEQPETGDDSRAYGPPFVGEESAYFMSVNRNKRSVALDFTTDRGRELLYGLMTKADVILENFRPNTLDEYGLGYEQVRDQNPDVIYTSLSGFGQDGPWKNKPGLDLTIQGLGGLMSLTGSSDGKSRRVGLAMGDLVSGIYAAMGTITALFHRERTGEGQHVDVSMLDSMVSLLSYQAGRFFATDEAPERIGNFHPTIAPYETFETKDGHINLALTNDGLFREFCERIGREDLPEETRFADNPSRVENREKLHEILEEELRERTTEDWVEFCDRHDLPAAKIQDLEEVFSHPQVEAREMIRNLTEVDGPDFKQTGIPIKMSESPGTLENPPPKLGEHTEQILTEELGLSQEEIRKLKNEDVLD